ncbi:hypothetical protein M1O29_03725 [Dehalococcoidia bacterium]|nr:hypothetical protein [Dehalococcoidia bacterium]
MRDAIELEWAGVPSVLVNHKVLCGSADSMKRVSGVPDYEYVVVDYPHAVTATWDETEIKELAKEVAPQIRELLTKQR